MLIVPFTRQWQLKCFATCWGATEALGDFEEVPQLKRFFEVAVRGQLPGLLRGKRVRRDQDYGNGCKGGVLELLRAKLSAIHDGHHQIEKDQAGRGKAVSKQVKRLLAIPGGYHPVAFILERLHHRPSNVVVVVHHQNGGSPRRVHECASGVFGI